MSDLRLTPRDELDEPAELSAAGQPVTAGEPDPPDHLDATVGDEEGWAITPRPIADGSQVLEHDGYDVQVFQEACREATMLQAVIDEWTPRVYTAAALVRDLFWSFYKRVPRIDPVVPLTPAYDYNRLILEQVLATTEHHSLRAAGTADDPLNSALATVGIVKRALGALDAATIDAMNRLAQHEGRQGFTRNGPDWVNRRFSGVQQANF